MRRKLLLVSMPWQSIQYPSIQLSLIKENVTTKIPDIDCHLIHGYLLWANYLVNRKVFTINEVIKLIDRIVIDCPYMGIGDWIFTKALYGTSYKKDDYLKFLKKNFEFEDEEYFFSQIDFLYESADDFIDNLVNSINLSQYKIIAFSSTFTQNLSSLALAKKIKEKSPEINIVFGGANCDDVQGKVLIKNFDFIDYIIAGEGENSFPKLVNYIFDENSDISSIPGLVYRTSNNEINKNDEKLVDIKNTPFPNYDDYFFELRNTKIGDYIQPQILIESSKGCWWGDKHHCLFCGINGKRAFFRARSPHSVAAAIFNYMTRYNCSDFFFTDNIMCQSYYDTLLPLLAQYDFDFNIFYEIKSNLTREKAKLLSEANIRIVQPGIESLNTNLLKKISKGVSAIQNIYTLKLCKEFSLVVNWNILYGFPFEKDDDYEIEKWKSLMHLMPPSTHGQIYLEKFSPFYLDESKGLKNLGANDFYSYIYNFNKKDLNDVAYLFKNQRCGISKQCIKNISCFIKEWKDLKDSSFLYYKIHNDSIQIIDSRKYRVKSVFFIIDDIWKEAFYYLRDIKSINSLYLHLNQKYNVSEEEIKDWCNNMVKLRYFYYEEQNYLSLVVPYQR